MKKKYDAVDAVEVGEVKKITRKATPVKDERQIVMKEYYVDLQEGQVSTVVLKPKQVVTITYGEDGNIYPECLRSLVQGGMIKEKQE